MNSINSDRLPMNPRSHEPDLVLSLSRLIQKVHRQMTTGASSDVLFNFIFDSLGFVIPYDRIGIAILRKQGMERKLVSTWVKSKLPVDHLKTNYSASIENSSLGAIIDGGQPRIVDDLAEYLALHPESESTKLILKDGIRSSLTCPLRAENRSIGVVFFSSAKPHTYRPEHAQFFLELADELSVIVEQGQLRDLSRSITERDQSFRMALHDLKSPLAVIQGYVGLAVEEDWFNDLNDDAKRIFTTLNRNAHHMADLINELSTLDHKGAAIELKEIDLRGFISALVEDGKSLSEKKEILFIAEVGDGLPQKFKADDLNLRRAVENLVTNAIKYSNRHTTITFSVTNDQGRLCFSVADQGQGIPESEIPKLFSEFGKTSVRPTEGEMSTGLGLAIVHKIAVQHGGTVSVESQVGKGSKFSISIPL